MPNKKPKTKIEEFKEEIKRAKTKEELAEIVKRLETYVKLHPSEEGYYLLAVGKYNLEDFQEALKWIQYAETLEARLFEVVIYISLTKFKRAYNLITELKKLVKSREMKKDLKAKEVFTLWEMWEYEEILKIWDEEIKQFLMDTDIELGHKIAKSVEGYQKAKEIINKNKDLKEAIEKIKEIVEKKVPQFKIVPIVEQDEEYPVEELWVYILVPKTIPNEEIDRLEEQVIDEIIFKKGIDINYVFMKMGEVEPVVSA